MPNPAKANSKKNRRFLLTNGEKKNWNGKDISPVVMA